MKLSIFNNNLENPLDVDRKRFHLSESKDKIGIAYETEFNYEKDDKICNKIITIVFNKKNIHQAEVKKILPI